MQFFVDKCNSDLSSKLRRHEADLAGMGTTERVRTAVKWRLEMLIPFMGQSFQNFIHSRRKEGRKKEQKAPFAYAWLSALAHLL